jgi:NitT/TauT family transport system substrate-binding protein
MTEALANREVDAVVIWEPESENSAQVLGDDLVEFSGDGVYRELFNLNTTAENLADPTKRAKVVRFVYAVILAADAIQTDPARAQALVAQASGFSPDDVRESWEHHQWVADIPADLLDVLEQEERWLAQQDNRPARSREQRATLIDTSVFDEAVALAGPE